MHFLTGHLHRLGEAARALPAASPEHGAVVGVLTHAATALLPRARLGDSAAALPLDALSACFAAAPYDTLEPPVPTFNAWGEIRDILQEAPAEERAVAAAALRPAAERAAAALAAGVAFPRDRPWQGGMGGGYVSDGHVRLREDLSDSLRDISVVAGPGAILPTLAELLRASAPAAAAAAAAGGNASGWEAADGVIYALYAVAKGAPLDDVTARCYFSSFPTSQPGRRLAICSSTCASTSLK